MTTPTDIANALQARMGRPYWSADGRRLVDENDPDVGNSITYFGFFTDKTMKRTIESLRYIGWEGDDLAELPTLAETGMLATENCPNVTTELFSEGAEPTETCTSHPGPPLRAPGPTREREVDLRRLDARQRAREEIHL